MNGSNRQRAANMVETGRLQALDRLQEAFERTVASNPIDVLIVAQWLDGSTAGQTRGPMRLVKAHGPGLVAGGGLGALLASAITALGQIFGN